MSPRPVLPDQRDRDAAVAERRRNVVIDAGAGTGKTTIVVARLVEMVAPQDDADAAIPMPRVAAVTFTRRAAGELRLRIRQSLLQALSNAKTSIVRRERLSAALSELDGAYVGTIHSFADRLLRMRPRDARISPAYQIAEDPEALLAETFGRLMHAAERDNLADLLIGTNAAPHAAEAQAALRDALSIGLLRETIEYDHSSRFGLDALVQGFIDTRDVEVPMPPLVGLDSARLHGAMRRFIDAMQPANPKSQAGARLWALARGFQTLLTQTEPVGLYTEILELLERHARASGYKWRKKLEFDGDAAGFEAWQRLQGNDDEPGIRATLMQTLGAWLGPRLLRVRPVAIALYEHTKRRHQLVDQLDLVIKLRDLLRDDLDSRGFYQTLFDHLFVDEFQDTDPLQAEVVAFLAERSPKATDWQHAELRPGKLTIVGDPKQSIYRFRRADIETYDAARALIARGAEGCLEVELEANFRSRAPLISWFNQRFDEVLQRSPDGRRFDPKTGAVYNRHLASGRPGEFPASVHVVPFEVPGGNGLTDALRQLEGEALAHYLAWLVEQSGTQIEDPIRGETRPLAFNDIAILCLSTTNLGLLFPQLDALNIPHAARGATLFLRDPVHRRFLLGLRALSDPDDGIAEAALLRPPFFAIDLRDLALERAARGQPDSAPPSASVERAREARRIVQTLRRDRFRRSPGSTARDLLETTGIGQAIAVGPNGLQRLERLRELCLILGQRAIDEHLDFDAVTAQMREWVDHPVQLDPPHPVGGDAIQIMTAHQAKGLEFPVVVFWDGCALWSDIERNIPFRPRRDGTAWSMTLDKLGCEVPDGAGLKEREGQYRLSERRRLVYVLATRARDLLVLPRAGAPKTRQISSSLLEDAPAGTTRVQPCYRGGDQPAWWERGPERIRSLVPGALAPDLEERWKEALAEAAAPRFPPSAVSTHAHGIAKPEQGSPSRLVPAPGGDEILVGTEPEERPLKAVQPREGRYGSTFGTTVHRALELLLLGHRASGEEAVSTAIAETGLDHHHKEALQDVERTVAMLDTEGLLPKHGRTIALEYPIAGSSADGCLLAGVIDFLSADGARVDVIDFKTDLPPVGDVALTHAGYVKQAHSYGALLAAAQIDVGRTGLLFTADGAIRWVT